MSNFCSECGNRLVENSKICNECGSSTDAQKIIINNIITEKENSGKANATVSVVFGSLGFYPLIFLGPIVGIITGIAGMTNKESKFVKRARLGFWLSVGSLSFWLIILLFFF